MKKLLAKLTTLATMLAASSAVSAFTPANGVWAVTSELQTGDSGRGFQIIVENDILVFSLYGYNVDGSGNFFLTSGPLVNNRFTGELLTCRDGVAMGSPYHPATCISGNGSINLVFDSGETGMITFPGEAAKRMTRFNFGYGFVNGPSTLLGSDFLFTYKATISSFTEYYKLTVNTGLSTQYGNGIVTSSDGNLACEYINNSTTLKDVFLCTELSGTYPDTYLFKLVNDRGNGLGTFKGVQGLYPLQVLRVQTPKNTRTGPYNENEATLLAPIIRQTNRLSENANDYLNNELSDMAKVNDMQSLIEPIISDSEKKQDMENWINEAKYLLN